MAKVSNLKYLNKVNKFLLFIQQRCFKNHKFSWIRFFVPYNYNLTEP